MVFMLAAICLMVAESFCHIVHDLAVNLKTTQDTCHLYSLGAQSSQHGPQWTGVDVRWTKLRWWENIAKNRKLSWNMYEISCEKIRNRLVRGRMPTRVCKSNPEGSKATIYNSLNIWGNQEKRCNRLKKVRAFTHVLSDIVGIPTGCS